MKKLLALSILTTSFLWVGCTNDKANDSDNETAQQMGDSMASIDEIGGSSGEIALLESNEKTFRRLAPGNSQKTLWQSLNFNAYAASCLSASTFGSCESNSIRHTLDECTLLFATFDGTVDFTWGGSSVDCQLQATGDAIVRVPDYSVTGIRGAELIVTNTGAVGQKLEWVDGTGDTKDFLFTNDGIRRVFKNTQGDILLDFTTETTDPIVVSGTKRSNRELNEGTLKVTNNKTNVSCNYTPEQVKWSSTCTCAVSGTWSGECSNGKTTRLELTGCGTGEFSIGDGNSTEVEFDRCIGI